MPFWHIPHSTLRKKRVETALLGRRFQKLALQESRFHKRISLLGNTGMLAVNGSRGVFGNGYPRELFGLSFFFSVSPILTEGIFQAEQMDSQYACL